jgi:hypothetical protein
MPKKRRARPRKSRSLLGGVLLFSLPVAAACAYALGLLPDSVQLMLIPELAPSAPELSARADAAAEPARPEPRLELESERTWVRSGQGFALLRLRNEGDVAAEAPEGRVRCTALDAQRRELGRWQAGDLGLLTPGEEITLRIGIPLRSGQLRSMDCRLVESGS